MMSNTLNHNVFLNAVKLCNVFECFLIEQMRAGRDGYSSNYVAENVHGSTNHIGEAVNTSQYSDTFERDTYGGEYDGKGYKRTTGHTGRTKGGQSRHNHNTELGG